LSAAVFLLGLGGLGGAALTAKPDPAPTPVTASSPRGPVEVRTVVRRRTVHVYRRPKRRHPPVAPPAVAAAPTVVPGPIAPAPVRASLQVTPTAPRLETSGGGAREGDDHEGRERVGGDEQ
jgi:hypothetical protein